MFSARIELKFEISPDESTTMDASSRSRACVHESTHCEMSNGPPSVIVSLGNTTMLAEVHVLAQPPRLAHSSTTAVHPAVAASVSASLTTVRNEPKLDSVSFAPPEQPMASFTVSVDFAGSISLHPSESTIQSSTWMPQSTRMTNAGKNEKTPMMRRMPHAEMENSARAELTTKSPTGTHTKMYSTRRYLSTYEVFCLSKSSTFLRMSLPASTASWMLAPSPEVRGCSRMRRAVVSTSRTRSRPCRSRFLVTPSMPLNSTAVNDAERIATTMSAAAPTSSPILSDTTHFAENPSFLGLQMQQRQRRQIIYAKMNKR
eukprot:Amastigsp_a509000_818.p2 type:complete len:316 gc:universal Amastigsp_a509000_818:1236-289(-)